MTVVDSRTRAVRRSLVEEAYARLKAEIMDNRMPPGFQALEDEVAQRLGMSRTPVREALVRLQSEGLVSVAPRRGMRVLPLSASDMREIYEILSSLEPKAAELIARQRPDAAMLRPLDEATSDMERALTAEDRDAWAAADDRFHRALLDLNPHRRLADIAGRCLDQAHRVRMFTLRLRRMPTQSTADHRTLVAALQRGDGALARDIHREHREQAALELLALIERYRLTHL